VFISVDWGTSNLRVRLARRLGGEMLAEVVTDDGVARLAAEHPVAERPAAYHSTLTRAVSQLADRCPAPVETLPVVISGMASSSLGWRELPYASLPMALDGTTLACAELPRVAPSAAAPPMLLVSGVCSGNDVMRGEETEALGVQQYLVETGQNDDRPAIWILPGTHSKHLSIERGRVVDFQTYMTGELFDVLGNHSVLRHALTGAADKPLTGAAADHEFKSGLDAAHQCPLTHALFLVRTRALLSGKSGAASASFLSGLLVGSELLAIAQRSTAAMRLVLAAGKKLGASYRLAIEHFGLAERTIFVPAEVAPLLSTRGQCALLESGRLGHRPT
jgi:2-dehydro-3-deoxygalactonokinase